MRRQPFPTHLAVLLGTLLLSVPIRGEVLPHFSLRTLSIDAPLIVVGTPEDKDRSTYRVVEVIHGDHVKIGDLLVIAQAALYFHIDPRPIKIERSLLFLEPVRDPAAAVRFVPLHSGVRCLAADGRVLRPIQFANPGDYVLTVTKGTDWTEMVAAVRRMAANAAEIRKIGQIPEPARRTEAAMKWIEAHIGEFAFGAEQWDDSPFHWNLDGPERLEGPAAEARRFPGWASLEVEAYRWVAGSGTLADCWRVATLYGDRDYRIEAVMRDESPFASRAGRAFLLDIATDVGRPVVEQRLALASLSGCWHNHMTKDGKRVYERLGEAEALAVVRRLLTLRNAPDAIVREKAVGMISLFARRNGECERLLVEAYRAEPAGRTRNQLASVVHGFTTAAAWKELTGNPSGIVALLTPREDSASHLTLDLSAQADVVIPREASAVLVPEGPQAADRSWTVAVTAAEGEDDGPWLGDNRNRCFVKLEVPLPKLPAGKYQLVIRGRVIAPQEGTWRSEALPLTIGR